MRNDTDSLILTVATAIILFLSTSVSAADDYCNGGVPDPTARAILAKFSTHRMPQSSDNFQVDVKFNLSQKDSGCLGAARGDFDDDGNQDYLVALSSKAKDGLPVVVALNQKTGWHVEQLAVWPGLRISLYVETGKPGRYERTATIDGPASEPDEVAAL